LTTTISLDQRQLLLVLLSARAKPAAAAFCFPSG
jgi:hypothetical protein